MSRKRTYTTLLLSLLLTSCALLPEPTEAPIESQTVGRPIEINYAPNHVFTLGSDSTESFNPVTTASSDNANLAPLVYEPLFRVTENFSVQPVLCERYETPDGKTYIFYVDTSRKFSDGTSFTARDARASIYRAWTSPRYSDRLDIMMGIDALSDSALMVTLKYPNTLFPALLDIPVYKQSSADAACPEGTGQYMFSADRRQLQRNPEHPEYDILPVDIIKLGEYLTPEEKISAFEGLELDLVTNDPYGQGFLGYGGLNEVRGFSTTIMHYLGYNFNSVYTRVAYLRYAAGFAVNRSGIAQTMMSGNGSPATLPVSPLSPLYDLQLSAQLDFSLEKSMAFLDAADIKDNDRDGWREIRAVRDPVPFELNFIVNSENTVKVAAAKEIAKNLEGVGIRVNLRELVWEDYLTALEEGDFDIYYAEVRLTSDFDLTRFLTEEGSLNFGGITDETYSQHISEYLSASDEDRIYYANMMYRYIADTAPITPIAFEKKQLLTHIGVISGLAPTQYNVFNNFAEWEIDFYPGESAGGE